MKSDWLSMPSPSNKQFDHPILLSPSNITFTVQYTVYRTVTWYKLTNQITSFHQVYNIIHYYMPTALSQSWLVNFDHMTSKYKWYSFILVNIIQPLCNIIFGKQCCILIGCWEFDILWFRWISFCYCAISLLVRQCWILIGCWQCACFMAILCIF
jgi:hypothetical protein